MLRGLLPLAVRPALLVLATVGLPLVAGRVEAQPPVEAQAPVEVQPPAEAPQPAVAAAPEVTSTVRFEQPPSRVQRRLAQLDALVADAQWTEAVELIQTLLADEGATSWVVEQEPAYFVSLADHCHARLASLPDEPLRLYRDAVDPAARQAFERAARGRDERALWRIVDETFCSRWADDALVALGEIALERGDFASARRCWRRVHPVLSDPAGRPLAWALRGVDLDEHGAVVAQRLSQPPRSRGWLVYPDTDIPLGRLLANLAVASAIEGDADRAEIELNLLRLLAPGEEGAVAGRRGLLVDLVEALVAESREWPPRAAAERRVGYLAGRVWASVRPLQAAANQPRWANPIDPRAGVKVPNNAPPVVEPVVWGRSILFRNAGALRAIDLVTGEPAITRSGDLYRGSLPGGARAGRAVVARGIRVFQRAPTLASWVNEPVVLAGDQFFARVEPGERAAAAVTRADGGPGATLRIIGRDLARENLTTLDLDPPAAPWAFGGPPVVKGERLYVALAADDVRPRVAIACYSAASGRQLWRTPIASGEPSPLVVPTAPSYRLHVDGGGVYLSTNFGAAAAVERRDGRVRWIVRYNDDRPDADAALIGSDRLAESVLFGGRFYVSPRDAPGVFAIDAASGRALWINQRAPGGPLLGVAGGVLVVGGPQLSGLDADSGRLRYQWPDGPKAGIRGMGRGCLAGGEVFWPTRGRLYAIDAATGAPTRESIDIADLGGTGATVVAARGLLVVAGAKGMTVLGPVSQQQADDGPKISQANQQFPPP